VVGTAASACGTTGGACANCAGQANNKGCYAGLCGCTAASDCQSLSACSLPLHSCQSLCGGANTGCNGGCCTNLSAGGQCVAGNLNNQCGGTGGQCADCQGACSPGPLCLLGSLKCGCNNNVDCFVNMSCSTRQTCSSANACQ
jgi:hypothetical protein